MSIDAIIVLTHDGTGNHKTPDKIVHTFTKTFESIDDASCWVIEQNAHPFLTCHIDSWRKVNHVHF